LSVKLKMNAGALEPEVVLDAAMDPA